MTKLILAVAIWSAFGLLASLYFRRRGHNLLLFAGLGLWLGPLVVPVMRLALRQQESVVRVLREGQLAEGWVDVLVGIDGSPESVESVRPVVSKLAPGIRRIRVVSALDAETANSPYFFDTDEALESELKAAAMKIGFENAELALVSGRADKALIAHAVDEGFDLLLVSARNHPVFGTLFGSTVNRLARRSPIPVLIGPAAGKQLTVLRSSGAQRFPKQRQHFTTGEMTS